MSSFSGCFQHFLYIFVVVIFSSVGWYPKQGFVLFCFDLYLFYLVLSELNWICGLKSHSFWRILGPIFKYFFSSLILYIFWMFDMVSQLLNDLFCPFFSTLFLFVFQLGNFYWPNLKFTYSFMPMSNLLMSISKSFFFSVTLLLCFFLVFPCGFISYTFSLLKFPYNLAYDPLFLLEFLTY